MDINSISIKNYKLFENITLSELKLVNVIIGKNNSGKSSLIDAISAVYDAQNYKNIKKYLGEIIGTATITKEMIDSIFSSYALVDNRWNRTVYSDRVIGKEIGFNITLNTLGGGNRIRTAVNTTDQLINQTRNYWDGPMSMISTELSNCVFRRLGAERNIVPETAEFKELSTTGEGASSLIRKYLIESGMDESLIEEKLLNELNDIFYPDGKFSSVRIQQIDIEKNLWEVFLQEEEKQRIPLSQMGSGLKTIILVLLNLHIVPHISQGSSYVFAFEEIENNLHPALQRRLFEYVYDFSIRNKKIIYLTTHSHVAINCFCDKDQASVYHIKKANGRATVDRIETYIDKAEILADLDVKASDLLQSNGIIWVEGPSDRVYVKKWLDLFTDNKFVEGKDYQFLYYGGRLLAQYSVEDNDKLVSILTTNRNAAIILDSDKKNRQTPINATKKRIVGKFSEMKMFAWVTKGKEIENYLPVEAIREHVKNDKVRQCKQYELFPRYIEKYYKGFSNKKVIFANEITAFLSKENCEGKYDLNAKVLELYKRIARWNGVDE